MTEFGETTVAQTTLASMFPISYALMKSSLMSSRTPQPLAPLAPEKVRPLILAPFSLTYTGFLKIADLNTELLFLARSICAPTQSVSGGLGVIGGPVLLINISFVDVTVDDVTVPLVIQGLNMSGNLSFSGVLTSFGILHIGYNSVAGNLTFGAGITLASFELYSSVVNGDIVLPSGPSMLSLLIYGQYPQISLAEVSNAKVYPSLTSLMYLNGVDGKGSRDIPSGARGFGAFTLDGLTQSSYPLITMLAVPDPWSVDLETLFPNLLTIFVIDAPYIGSFAVPSTPHSRYTSLIFISASQITSLDLTARATSLTGGIRIVGCPLLTGVLLRQDPNSTTPLREYRTLVIERCALLYLRGTPGMNRTPTTLRLGDHTSPTLSVASRALSNVSYHRLLDYILLALPTFGDGNTTVAVASDYLPNVLVTLAETVPTLIAYPVMQTVEYSFTRPAAVIANDPSGSLTTTYTQYSGGANPVVPGGVSSGSVLTSASITVSPFGVRYSFRVLDPSQSSALLSATTSPQPADIRGNTKKSLFSSHGLRTTTIVVTILGILLIIGALVGVAIVVTRRRAAAANRQPKTYEPILKK